MGNPVRASASTV